MKKNQKNRLTFILLLIIILLITATTAFILWSVFSANVRIKGKSSAILLIPTGAGFETVKDSLYAHGYIIHPRSFEWTAARKGYVGHVQPGRYRIHHQMSNHELLNLLRSGRQEPVDLMFQCLRTPAELAGKVSGQIEADSVSLLRLMNDPVLLRAYGVTPLTLFTITIPNTYEFRWNTSAKGFLSRMADESKKFWQKRKGSADSIGLSTAQVVVLASIVEKETAKNSEKPVIAGVYMNRLKRGIALQADPTLIFAWNDYTIHRVLNRHKEILSPYNTYLNTGLPPGPICLPSIASIDAVLHYQHHQYLFFCARPDFSGYHDFAETLAAHQRNAAKYQRALKEANIMK